MSFLWKGSLSVLSGNIRNNHLLIYRSVLPITKLSDYERGSASCEISVLIIPHAADDALSHVQGCGNTLSDLVPFHSGQVTCLYDRKLMQFSISYLINYFELACSLENSLDPDHLASAEAS